MRNLVAVAVALVFLLSAGVVHGIPCFPGAEGFGTQTPGGRGGRVIVVTNLNDDGPGSLRAAVSAKGPRMIVFGIGGEIRLKKALRITEPFVTIAGQSAPGKGICLRDAVVKVETHDVVIRFIRVRIGASLNEDYDEQNCIEVTGENAYNVVIDHCTFSWSIDEGVGMVSGAHDCTFSWNIVSEALRQPFTSTKIGKERSHSMGLILGNYPNRCSVHHNLLANCNSRMPRIQGGTHDFVNNVVYDWGFLTGTFSREPNVNFIGNYYKPGPSSQPIKPIVDEGEDQGRIYVKGNRCPDRPHDDMPEWESITNLDPVKHRAEKPFDTVPLTITSADQAYKDVLAYAGCRLPMLDDADKRIIRQAYLGYGVKIDRPEDVGGFPKLPIIYGPPDSDCDGIPDEWERIHGLNPADPSDSAKLTGDGYTNLEHYLNSLVENWMNEPAKVVTYPIPDAVNDSPYVVYVNGKNVPIERGGTIQGAYYARFQFTKTVRATVTLKQPNDEIGLPDGKVEITLKPERYCDSVVVSDREISFDVSQAGPRVLTVKVGDRDLWPLIVVAEDYDFESVPSGFGVFNVRDYGVTSEGIQTANIQRVLDECAKRPDGGTVYFPPGVYHTGTIRIGNNTTVYLAPGSLIVGSTNPADYPVDPGRKEEGSHGPTASNSRLIMFDHCSNSSIRGYGVIEGMGHIVRNQYGRHVQIIDVTASKNIRIENVVLRNSCGWTLHILACDKVYIDNLKIINDYKVGNTDGIDPDGSRNVYVRRYFGYCGDDAVAIKTTGNSDLLYPATNIEFRDCVVMTRKTAYKIGTETYADISDVLFEACEAINSSRGIGIWECDGHVVSDVTYRDIKLDLHEIDGEKWSGEPIRAVVEGRHGFGKIKDILFDRVKSISPYRAILAGVPDSVLENFNFWGCRFVVKPREIKMGKQPVVLIKNARDFAFKGMKLHWLAQDAENWDDFIGQENTRNILVREIEETR